MNQARSLPKDSQTHPNPSENQKNRKTNTEIQSPPHPEAKNLDKPK